MNRIAKITVPLAIVVSLLIIYIFVDLATLVRDLRREKDWLRLELDSEKHERQRLNESMLGCIGMVAILSNRSKEYYDNWQTERTIAYALWQIVNEASNVTWKGEDYTRINIMVPRWQWDYLRNLSETYRPRYQGD